MTVIKRQQAPEPEALTESLAQDLVYAPRLHPMKMLDSQVMAMALGACLRYWQARKGKRG